MVQKLKAPSGKIIVGLTGSFGSGKSTVGGMFEELGAKVIDADTLVHEALNPSSPVFAGIRRLFEKAVDPKTGTLDRKKIAQIIFHDAGMKKKLESIVHPYVFERMLEEGGKARATVIVLEVPLLFETGFHYYCHRTVTVKADDAGIEKRLQKKGFSSRQVNARRKAQMPLEEKGRLSDFVVDNSGDLGGTRKEVKKIWNQIVFHQSKEK